MKYLIIAVCVISLYLGAQTNVLPKKSSPLEDHKILDLAWQEYDYFISENGFLVIKQPLVIKAKLSIFDFYFMDHPANNRFQDIMLSFESDLVAKDYEIKRQKRKKYAAFFKGLAAGIGASLATFLVVKIVKK